MDSYGSGSRNAAGAKVVRKMPVVFAYLNWFDLSLASQFGVRDISRPAKLKCLADLTTLLDFVFSLNGLALWRLCVVIAYKRRSASSAYFWRTVMACKRINFLEMEMHRCHQRSFPLLNNLTNKASGQLVGYVCHIGTQVLSCGCEGAVGH